MENSIYMVVIWAVALVFVIIGIYAMFRKKPMGLWTGSKIPESRITDVKAYNRAHGKMWCAFSIPFWLGGIIEYFSPALAIFIFALTCTVGIGAIVWCYHKIEEKYILKP